ncbi:MAG: hypothetical protein WCN85_10610 [Burkholderiales bacterium]
MARVDLSDSRHGCDTTGHDCISQRSVSSGTDACMQFVTQPASLSVAMMKLHVHEGARRAGQITVDIGEGLRKGRSLRIIQ